jgi:hypothetical protein
MKLRHPATLALVVWYLMRPPLPHLNAHSIRVDPAAPLARWKIAGTFATQKECEAGRGVAAPPGRCQGRGWMAVSGPDAHIEPTWRSAWDLESAAHGIDRINARQFGHFDSTWAVRGAV